jgi:predicted transposase YdaD
MSDYYNIIDTAAEEAEKRGLKKGREEGRAEGLEKGLEHRPCRRKPIDRPAIAGDGLDY